MSALVSPPRIGALWQQRIQAMKEYEIVREGNVFSSGFSDSVVFTSEYDRARARLAELVDRYAGTAFDNLFPGQEIENDGGTCFVLEHRNPVSVPSVDIDRFKKDLMNDLTLVLGVGPATRRRLNARGYYTLENLLEHPGLRNRAQKVLAGLHGDDPSAIMDLAGRRHSKSHATVLGAACLVAPEDLVFLDIETLGLFSRPIILFGIGMIEHGQLVVRQYLLRDVTEEQAALIATADHLVGERKALVTFNGKAFDLPYVTDRLAYYGLECPGRIPHFDVLHFSRRRWRNQLPSLRLTNLEQAILNIPRHDDIPGQMVPEFYETYLRSGNAGPLVPVVEHNRQDVISLALLFFCLLEESYGTL